MRRTIFRTHRRLTVLIERTLGRPRARRKTSSRTRLIYWNNIPSPYFVDRMNCLAARSKLDVAAWFTERREPDGEWAADETTWSFEHAYLGKGPAAALRAIILLI